MTAASRIWLTRHAATIAVAAIVVFVAVIRLRVAAVPLERDEGEYAYAGQLILQGEPPYRLEYNMKFPGTYYAYAAILGVFGQTPWGVHVGLLIVNAMTIVVLFLLGRRLIGELGGTVAALIFALLSVSRWIMGVFAHASHFVVLPALAGLLVLLRAFESGRKLTFIGAGALLGTAVLMKQPGVAFLLIAAVLTARHALTTNRRWLLRELGCLALGAALPMVLLVVVLTAQGVLGRFWFWTYQYAREYVAEVPLSLAWTMFLEGARVVTLDNVPLWLLGGTGVLFLFASRWPASTRWTVGGLTVASVAALVPGWYFRPHYFILALPAISLLGGVSAESFRRAARRWLGRSAATGAILLVVGCTAGFSVVQARHYFVNETPNELSAEVYGNNPFVEAPEAARFMADRTAPDEKIAVVGSEPEIYFYANRRSATGYIYTYGLMERQPYASRMQQEMIEEIEASRPKFLAAIWANFSWLAQPQSDDRIILWLVRYVDRCYDSARQISDLVTIYVRKTQAPCTAGDEPEPFHDQPSTPERLDTYRKAFRLQPELVNRLNERGRALAEQGRIVDAMAYFAEALRFDPAFAGTHYNLAVALGGQQRIPEAIGHYRDAVRLAPDFAEAHSNLGNMLSDTGQLDESLIEMMTAIRLQPARPDFQFNAAVLFYRRHDVPHALEHLRAALAIDASYAPARQMLAELTKRR